MQTVGKLATYLVVVVFSILASLMRMSATHHAQDTKTWEPTVWDSQPAVDKVNAMSDSEIQKLVLETNVIDENGIIRDKEKLEAALANITLMRQALDQESSLAKVHDFQQKQAIRDWLFAEEVAAKWALANPKKDKSTDAEEIGIIRQVEVTLEAMSALPPISSD